MLSNRINGKKLLLAAMLFVLMFLCGGVTSQAKWSQNSDGTYSWIKSNGKKATSTWIKDKQYVDEKGNRVTGKYKINGKYYYFDKSNGYLVKSQWIKTGSNYKYAQSDGVLCQSGKFKIGSYYYYFNKNCNRKTGLKTIDGKSYYFDADNQGRMVKKKWVCIDGKYYRFNTKGVMRKSTWVLSKKYYVNKNGVSVTGLQTIDGKTYYFDKSTRKKVTNTTKTVNGVTYKFDKNGVGTIVEDTSATALIFVGDSRTVGMESAVGKKSGTYYIAKESIGYDWLVNTASSKIDSYLKDYPAAKVVFAFGINDLGNISNYISYYNKLISKYPKASFYMMSVNPVNESTEKKYGYTVTNSQISSFNTKLKNAFPSQYLDVYSYLNKNGFSTTDGIHYTASTYKTIYNYVVSLIG